MSCNKLSCIVDDVRLKFEMAREYILGVRVFRLFKEEECVWDGSKKKEEENLDV